MAANLADAYKAAEYHVLIDSPFVMKVGQFCPELAALMSMRNCECGIFITAYNPFSIRQRADANEASNAELLKQLGGKVIAGAGRSPSGDWPEEKSFLALGYEYPDTGYKLARQYGQNAFLWIDEGCIPRLLISNRDMMTQADINLEYNLTLGAQWRSRHLNRPAPAGSGLDYESFLTTHNGGKS